MDGLNSTVRVGVDVAPIDVAAMLAEVSRADAGATVLFLGTVRDHNKERTGVTHLDYEVYEEKVGEVIEEIIAEAARRWPMLGAVVEHRAGVVKTGEASVAVAISSAHRADAFDAARFVIDELKERAPIWKKEHWLGGSEWSRGS